MEKYEKIYKQRIDRFNRGKVVAGVIIFLIMLLIHTYLKDLEWFIWAMPFGLVGIQAQDVIKKKQ